MPGRGYIQKFLKEAVAAGCKYALIEVTSQGVVAHRHRFVNWNVGAITNLAPEHIESHGSFENYRDAKLSFLKYAQKKGGTWFSEPGRRVLRVFQRCVAGRENPNLRQGRRMDKAISSRAEPHELPSGRSDEKIFDERFQRGECRARGRGGAGDGHSGEDDRGGDHEFRRRARADGIFAVGELTRRSSITRTRRIRLRPPISRCGRGPRGIIRSPALSVF